MRAMKKTPKSGPRGAGQHGGKHAGKGKPRHQTHGERKTGPREHKHDHKPTHKQTPAGGAKHMRADLYGSHAVAEAWLNPARKIKALYITQNALEGFEETLAKAEALGLSRPAPSIMDKPQLDAATPEGAVHQGIALLCAPLPEMDVNELIIRERANSRSTLVILDQVTDPHNIGAIMRSACAFGAAGMIMQRKHAPDITGPAGGLLAKTACGALEHVPVVYETNLSRTIETLQEAGYFVYGLDERGQDIAGMNIADRAVLVLGAEGPGLRHLVKEHCDALVRLPMDGPMPSVNVSNAAAVALYAVSRR